MGEYVAGRMVKAMLQKKIDVTKARVLILGLTFKENCPDVRNTKVIDVVRGLEDYGLKVDVHDPYADADEALDQYGVTLCGLPAPAHYDGILLTVPHAQFRNQGVADLRAAGRNPHVFFDLKSIFSNDQSDLRL